MTIYTNSINNIIYDNAEDDIKKTNAKFQNWEFYFPINISLYWGVKLDITDSI